MTANFLHKIASEDEIGIYSSRIILFSQQLLHRVPSFSCGLFVFDFSLGFKVIKQIIGCFDLFHNSCAIRNI